MLKKLPTNFKIINNFISIQEESKLYKILDKLLDTKFGLQYEPGHLDNVIHNYRECSLSNPTDLTHLLIRAKLLFPQTNWHDPHILQLKDDSYIDFHVDNVNASGNIIAGVCLNSDSVMVLKHVDDGHTFNVFLPRRCLYYQLDDVRYNYSHAIPVFVDGFEFERRSRISILLRNMVSVRV